MMMIDDAPLLPSPSPRLDSIGCRLIAAVGGGAERLRYIWRREIGVARALKLYHNEEEEDGNCIIWHYR